jgi:hypothetical protein
MPVPDRPEHHYRYDPAKSADGPPRPRRAASARLDLSLALIAAGHHDEAAGTALEAITSGRIVPSNYWRAREVIQAVAERGVPEAAGLAEAYRNCQPAPPLGRLGARELPSLIAAEADRRRPVSGGRRLRIRAGQRGSRSGGLRQGCGRPG